MWSRLCFLRCLGWRCVVATVLLEVFGVKVCGRDCASGGVWGEGVVVAVLLIPEGCRASLRADCVSKGPVRRGS